MILGLEDQVQPNEGQAKESDYEQQGKIPLEEKIGPEPI